MTEKHRLPPVPQPPPGTSVSSVTFDGEHYRVVSFPLDQIGDLDVLTATEQEIARSILQGQSNNEIARERGRSPRTIINQVAAVFKKLGVTSRIELIARCRSLADK